MQLDIGTPRTDRQGNIRIPCEFVNAPSYAPGSARRAEADLQAQFNNLSAISMGHLLKTVDTNGGPIHRDGIEYYSKGRFPEAYQTAGGPTTSSVTDRHGGFLKLSSEAVGTGDLVIEKRLYGN